MKRLSDLMLLSNFLSTLFYSASYPYIYAEIVKAISRHYISFEQIVSCSPLSEVSNVCVTVCVMP